MNIYKLLIPIKRSYYLMQHSQMLKIHWDDWWKSLHSSLSQILLITWSPEKVDWIISLTFSVIQRSCPPTEVVFSIVEGLRQEVLYFSRIVHLVLYSITSPQNIRSLRLSLQECLIIAQQHPKRARNYSDHPRIPRWPRKSNKIKTFHELYTPCLVMYDCLP